MKRNTKRPFIPKPQLKYPLIYAEKATTHRLGPKPKLYDIQGVQGPKDQQFDSQVSDNELQEIRCHS